MRGRPRGSEGVTSEGVRGGLGGLSGVQVWAADGKPRTRATVSRRQECRPARAWTVSHLRCRSPPGTTGNNGRLTQVGIGRPLFSHDRMCKLTRCLRFLRIRYCAFHAYIVTSTIGICVSSDVPATAKDEVRKQSTTRAICESTPHRVTRVLVGIPDPQVGFLLKNN